MKKWYRSWKEKLAVKGNILPFAVLTFIITVILNGYADKALTYYLNTKIQSIYTYNYSLGLTGILLAVPAAFISILLLMGWFVFAERYLPPSTRNKIAKTAGWCFSVAEIIMKGLWKVVCSMKYVAFFILFIIGLFGGSSSRSSSGGYSTGGGPVSRSSNSSHDKQLKKTALWNADQKQKEADYARNHAVDQARYNINTHHFTNKANRANTLQREADEAKRRARNL